MSRLQAEAARLYLPLAGQPEGHVRALVLSLGRPAEWASMARLSQAVQTELGWPAPAIAVSGTDSYQLWFSLAKPVPLTQAHACLKALCERQLPGIAASRLALWPSAEGTEGAPGAQAQTLELPGRELAPEQWSAFVAPDLAPMFAETPWLDIPPSPEGQAEMLSRLSSITPAAWQGALDRWQTQDDHAAADTSAPPQALGMTDHTGGPARYDDPRRFLLDVMNDDRIAMALRIEAAKALMPPQRPPSA